MTRYDLNMRRFHERLREVHGIQLSYAWVQTALQAGPASTRTLMAGWRSAIESKGLSGALSSDPGNRRPRRLFR